MALPGVRTVLKDRFYSLSRTDTPEGIRLVGIAHRGADSEYDEVDNLDTVADPASGDRVVFNGRIYRYNATRDTWEDQGIYAHDYSTYRPRSEEDVIRNFGAGSPAHRLYLEATAGGAPRITIVALPSDANITSTGEANPFDRAFDAAETERPDIIVPWGAGGHPDGAPDDLGFQADIPEVARRVAEKCKDITDRTSPCFAVLGVSPAAGVDGVGTTDLDNHFAALTLPNREEGWVADAGPYVSVVATEIRPTGYGNAERKNGEETGAWGFSNGAAMYGGAITGLAAWNATTGKTLFNVSQMRYIPTRPQQQDLIDMGVVPVTQNFNRVPVWVDGVTFARPSSDYTRLSTLRIVFETMQRVRQSAETFVGQPATLTMRNALDTAITSVLREMKIQGSLMDADHVITYSPRENKAQIDLVLEPAFEMRNIEISISVRL